MSAFIPDVPHPAADATLPLTGERTIPGLDVENYWFRRHEVVYQQLAQHCAGRDVLEAGCGDIVVNFQVIEHLWDQPQFVGECFRVLRPAGLLMVSTPNRITFSPGRDTPINPFHTRELNADELTTLLRDAGFTSVEMNGVFHGPRLAEMDARHGGSIIDAQIARAVADAPWPDQLLADVAAVTAADFEVVEAGARDIDASLDLVAIAVRPADDDDAGAAGIEEWRR
jgi:SAM-dependent methyltransferase